MSKRAPLYRRPLYRKRSLFWFVVGRMFGFIIGEALVLALAALCAWGAIEMSTSSDPHASGAGGWFLAALFGFAALAGPFVAVRGAREDWNRETELRRLMIQNQAERN